VSDSPVKILTSHRVLQSCLELEFLFECIFPGVPCVTRLSDCGGASTVVYLEYDLDAKLCEQISRTQNLLIYHLGDETAIKDLSGYVFAKAVFRNYYHERIFADLRFTDRLYWMPNGFRNGLKNQHRHAIRPVSERPVLASFIGWLSNPNAVANERAAFQSIAPACANLLQCIPTQGFAGGFSPHLYKALLEDAVFAPCPAGNAAETIRLFDAMECGCIPISLKHPFLQRAICMANPPFEFLDRWEDLPHRLKSLEALQRDEPARLVKMQDAVKTYWRALKSNGRSKALMYSLS